MPKYGAQFVVSFGVNILSFILGGSNLDSYTLYDSMSRSKIQDLRSTIYQTWDSTLKLKKVKQRMIQILVDVEERLLKTFWMKILNISELLIRNLVLVHIYI